MCGTHVTDGDFTCLRIFDEPAQIFETAAFQFLGILHYGFKRFRPLGLEGVLICFRDDIIKNTQPVFIMQKMGTEVDVLRDPFHDIIERLGGGDAVEDFICGSIRFGFYSIIVGPGIGGISPFGTMRRLCFF